MQLILKIHCSRGRLSSHSHYWEEGTGPQELQSSEQLLPNSPWKKVSTGHRAGLEGSYRAPGSESLKVDPRSESRGRSPSGWSPSVGASRNLKVGVSQVEVRASGSEHAGPRSEPAGPGLEQVGSRSEPRGQSGSDRGQCESGRDGHPAPPRTHGDPAWEGLLELRGPSMGERVLQELRGIQHAGGGQ